MEVGFQAFTQLGMSDEPGGILFGRDDTFPHSGQVKECFFDAAQIGSVEIVMITECQRIYVTGVA